ncbi:hypothetical protein FRB93_011503 [Tulasnella sp. JGI-2019a]|nr:hypothetical protein FRB93_011503 [Tulasnella sp. JGI-2019a]
MNRLPGHVEDLTEPQRGQLWGEYIATLLFGFYSCLLIITLWRPIGTRRLTAIAWIIIATYFLTLCRVVVDYPILDRAFFVTGGNPGELQSTDYVLRGVQQGVSSAAALLSDGLFCWRLYVIWSRSIRIILLPVCLLVITAIGATAIVATNLVTARRLQDHHLLVMAGPLFMAAQGVVIVYTCYMTIFIAGRLWWVGNAVKQITSPEQPRKNRYSGAIYALIQSGVMQSVTRILVIIAAATVNLTMTPIVGRIAVQVNGISATLLVLQLDLFQKKARHLESPPLTTGPTFKFADPEATSSSESGERQMAPVTRRRRASMPIAVYLPPP